MPPGPRRHMIGGENCADTHEIRARPKYLWWAHTGAERPLSEQANPPRGGDAKPRVRDQPDSRAAEEGVMFFASTGTGGLPHKGDRHVFGSSQRIRPFRSGDIPHLHVSVPTTGID